MALVLAIVAALLLTISSTPPVASQGVWDEITNGPTNSDMVALTFDAGSVEGPALSILNTLRENGIKLTFFLTGQWVESYPEIARQVAEDGHELANHTYYHPDLTRLSNSQVVWEFDYTDGIIQTKLGRSSRPWFRPPFGARNQRVLDIARELGFRSIYWTIDSLDWRNNATAASVYGRVMNSIGPGDIVVHHVAAYPTAEALPDLIAGIRSRGLRIVTVSELLGARP